MKTFTTFAAILLTATVLGCGGGGGGGVGASNPDNSGSTNSYVVSTVALAGNSLNAPKGIANDTQGNLYVADSGTNLIRKIANVNTSPTVSTVLGGGNTSYSSCLNSVLDSPYAIAIDNSSHLYLAELNKPAIRYADCTVSTTFSQEYGSVNVTGLTLSNASGVFWYNSTLYVSDAGNHKIRTITDNGLHSGITSTLAGTTSGYVNAAVGSSAFARPTGIAVDSAGRVFVADTDNCTIRLIASGQVSTFAGAGPNNLGTGPVACGSNDGTGTAARFDHPTGISIDDRDNLYVADSANNKIRFITPLGVVTTIAGTGVSGATDGSGSSATFNTPTGITLDASGNLFVVDSGSSKIRKITVPR